MTVALKSLLSRQSVISQGLLSTQAPQSIFVIPESAARSAVLAEREAFVFQYWPESIDDSAPVDYATHSVFGGTHPIFQWTGGSGREITFSATFTSEVDPGVSRGAIGTPNPAAALASDRYTVDIRAALNRLRSFRLPSYSGVDGDLNSLAQAPPRLYLVIPGSRMGGNKDYLLTILADLGISIRAWFPSGVPRLAEVTLTFRETVQSQRAGGGAAIRFADRRPYADDGTNYTFRGSLARVVA